MKIITQMTQYYKNNNNVPMELNIIYPFKKEINFRKFIINVNWKKSISKIFTKEKAKENYTDIIVEGNIDIISKYSEDEPNSYSINIGNTSSDTIVELTRKFIKFISNGDISFCFSVMIIPLFLILYQENMQENINGKIFLKSPSKVTKL